MKSIVNSCFWSAVVEYFQLSVVLLESGTEKYLIEFVGKFVKMITEKSGKNKLDLVSSRKKPEKEISKRNQTTNKGSLVLKEETLKQKCH